MPQFEEPIPGLGDLFAMGLMRPVPGPSGAFGDVIQPLGPMGVLPPTGREALIRAHAKGRAPAVHTRGNEALVKKIYEQAERQRSPQYPPATEPVFAPADPALTKQLVPQRSIAANLPPTPTPDKLPFKARALPIMQNTEAIGNLLAEDLRRVPGQPLPFYSTGTVLQGLMDKGGLSLPESQTFMRDWAGQGAATSPRTATPQNLRNAAYLMYRRAQGDPLTTAKREAEGNRPGFAMMGMHTDLADQFAAGTNDLWANPKPGTFRENWTGNMADVTADTHNIRKILDAYDRLNPGGLPREWFNSDKAFATYKAGGGFPKEGMLPVGDIRDSLGGGIVAGTGRKAQTEYPIMQGPTIAAARMLGIAPAEAQEQLWFEGGPRTGLRSPPMTIPDLFNSQFEATARATGLDPVTIMRLFARRQIPLAENKPMTDLPGASAVG